MAEINRERWTGRAPFIFAAIGSAIGLGNVWRFPYLTYKFGGGAFLVTYIVGLFLLGIPWMMMEFGMGHHFQKGAPGVFSGIGKKWEWLGWWPSLVAFIIVTYYTVVIAWTLQYTLSSLTVAWGTGQAGAKAAGDFFFKSVLQLSDGPGVLGAPVWSILGLLAVVWVLLFLVMYRGARVIGKASIPLVIIPWVLIIALIIRGITLPGAAEGLNYYLAPTFKGLGNPEMWFAAFSQIAFSLSLGMAGMFAYGSFVARKSDLSNNAAITSFSDTATSFFAGFAVFSLVGFIMQAMNVPIDKVTASGLGLAFVTYPAGVSMMPGANALTGVLFFLCLFFLGFTSAYFLAYGGVITPLVDKFGWNKTKTTFWVCVACFVVGILYTTKGGLYWLDIIDRSMSFYGLLITGALACLVVGWGFGAKKLREHLNATSDIKVGAWFDWMIKVVVPAILLFVVIYGGFMKDLAKPYEGYPMWAASMIWVVLVGTLVIAFILQSAKAKAQKGGETK